MKLEIGDGETVLFRIKGAYKGTFLGQAAMHRPHALHSSGSIAGYGSGNCFSCALMLSPKCRQIPPNVPRRPRPINPILAPPRRTRHSPADFT